MRIVVGPGALIGGRVVFDGTAPRTKTPTAMRVSAQAVDAGPMSFMTSAYDPTANGEVDESGAFRLRGVFGRVFIGVNVALPWVVRSVTLAGENVTDVPVEFGEGAYTDVRIELTDRPTEIAGRVTDDRGRPQQDYVIVILPAEKLEVHVAARRTRLLRPDSDGHYTGRGIRPGRYVAVALEAIEDGRQYTPEFQERLRPRARSFSLGEGESITLDLELMAGF